MIEAGVTVWPETDDESAFPAVIEVEGDGRLVIASSAGVLALVELSAAAARALALDLL